MPLLVNQSHYGKMNGVGHKTRIMYIECKAGSLTGPARIGRVTYSKTGASLFYRGKHFISLKGSGFKANYRDVETGEDYWISGHAETVRTSSTAPMYSPKSTMTFAMNIGPQSGNDAWIALNSNRGRKPRRPENKKADRLRDRP